MWSMDAGVELKVLRDLIVLAYGVQWRMSLIWSILSKAPSVQF